MDQIREIEIGLKNKRRATKKRFVKNNYTEMVGDVVTWPLSLENSMRNDLRDNFATVFPVIRTLQKNETAKRILSWNTDLDTYDSDIDVFLNDMEKALSVLFASFTESQITRLLSQYYDSVTLRVIGILSKNVSKMVGYDFIYSDRSYITNKRAWVEEKYKELKAIYDDTLNKIKIMITTGIQAGWAPKEFMDGIFSVRRRNDTTRQSLFVHQFIGSLTVSIMKSFFMNIGMDEYVWTTQRDERVRGNPAGRYPDAVPSHWIIDDKICKWNNASLFSDDGRLFRNRTLTMPKVHPGMEINCRCTARMFWGNLVRKADESIKEEKQ